jgi:dTDP-4-dehydrorhamnose reductase
MRKIMVLGASGVLGSRLVADLENCIGTYYSDYDSAKLRYFALDASNFEELRKLIIINQPDVIINCIGLTNVDECERLPEKNWLLNNNFPVEAASYSGLNNIKFVQISTDHFELNNSKKISESSNVASPNQYSFAKLTTERMIQEINPRAIIIRTNFFQFSFRRSKTFVDQMLTAVLKKQLVESFGDVYFTPVSISTLINCISRLIDIDYAGIINISSDEAISKFHFHELILKSYRLDRSSHKSISLSDLKLLARRSSSMVLDNYKLKSLFGISDLNIYDMIAEEIDYQKQGVQSVKK